MLKYALYYDDFEVKADGINNLLDLKSAYYSLDSYTPTFVGVFDSKDELMNYVNINGIASTAKLYSQVVGSTYSGKLYYYVIGSFVNEQAFNDYIEEYGIEDEFSPSEIYVGVDDIEFDICSVVEAHKNLYGDNLYGLDSVTLTDNGIVVALDDTYRYSDTNERQKTVASISELDSLLSDLENKVYDEILCNDEMEL